MTDTTRALEALDAFEASLPFYPVGGKGRLAAIRAALGEAGAAGDLDARLKARGMFTVAEMMEPKNRFEIHAGMTDLAFFEKWLESKVQSYTSMFARRELGDPEDDDLYEWVLAHKAAFHSVLINYRAALQGQST